MKIFYCNHCGAAMGMDAEHLGWTIPCPTCGGAIKTSRLTKSGAKRRLEDLEPQTSTTVEFDPWSSRSKVAAGVLGLVFGAFGVHRFYLGYIGIGILQIIVTVCTCGFGAIWGFVEGLMCFTGGLTDVDGRPLRD